MGFRDGLRLSGYRRRQLFKAESTVADISAVPRSEYLRVLESYAGRVLPAHLLYLPIPSNSARCDDGVLD